MSQNTLKVENLTSGYGDIQIIKDVNLDIDQAETCVVLSLNGAGKSTLLKSIAGLISTRFGKISLEGHDISRLPTYERARKGLVFASENVFAPLSVSENLKVAAYMYKHEIEQRKIAEALEMFPDLESKKSEKAINLSGGQRKMLTIAMALVSNPKVLLIDEPSAGLSPVMVNKVINYLEEIKKRGITMMVAEQNPAFAKLADEVVVLSLGKLTFKGKPDEMLANSEVQRLLFS